MALHDFRCAACGEITRDVYIPATIGATAGAPWHCRQPMHWIPQTRAMDIGAVKGAGFTAFTVYDGQNRQITIDSLHKLRQVERESEQQHRNGEGQPLVFRAWANDRSNRDQSALHKTLAGGEQLSPEAKARFGKPIRSATEPDYSFGPGVSEANASALPPPAWDGVDD